MGEQVVGLEHDPDVGPELVQVGPDVGDVLALEPHLPLRRDLEQVHAPKQRRFAATPTGR